MIHQSLYLGMHGRVSKMPIRRPSALPGASKQDGYRFNSAALVTDPLLQACKDHVRCLRRF